jgi:hypothetical protein
MKYRLQAYLALLLALPSPLCAISVVYNFRIAQITKQPITDEENYNRHTAIALIFDQYSKTHNDTSQNFFGGLAAYIYTHNPYFVRADFAVSHFYTKDQCTTTFSGTETDDILFTAGYNFKFGDRKVLTPSLLFGVPTHQVFNLKHASFGYGLFSLGGQLDGSYPISTDGAFLGGVRYIRFFKRNAQDEYCNDYRFSIGNVQDFLVAWKNNWQPHGIELGYTARFLFGASVSPHFDDLIEKTDYIRSNWYAVYKYKFALGHTLNRLLLNVSYGFDHRPHVYGNKYIIFIWGSWNVNF